MTQTYGEVNWDSAGKGDKSNGKDIWMRLKEGSNEVRIITMPHQFLVHKTVKSVGDKGFGQRVNCSMANGSCPLCEKGHPVTTRWYLGIIDKSTNSYKVLDIGGSIFYAIKALNSTAVWKDPRRYNVDIIRNSKADPQHYYNVSPIPPTPLSAADQKIVDEADLDDLKRRVTPPTVEQVKNRLEKILEGKPLFIPEVQSKEKSGKTPKVVSAAPVVENDGDDLFPSYE